MANPRFTDRNGNLPYIWEEMPVIPSDRADIAFLNTDIGAIEYRKSGILVGRKHITRRGKGKYKWSSITLNMVRNLQPFASYAYFRFYPDADVGTYDEVFISNQFQPTWQPGGRYDLTLDLRQYS